MKKFYSIILSMFIGLALVGCNKNPDPENPANAHTLELNLNFATKSQAANTVGTLGEAEYAVGTVRVCVFNLDGSIERNYFTRYTTPKTENIVENFKVSQAAYKDLVIILNEPSELTSTLEDVENQAQLRDVNYTIAASLNKKSLLSVGSYTSSDYLLPMTAALRIEADANQDISIGVNRAVARVDLTLNKISAITHDVKLTSGTKFNIKGLTTSSKLVESEQLEAPAAVESFEVAWSGPDMLLTEDPQRVLSFYMAERGYDKTDEDTRVEIEIEGMDFGGTPKNNTIVLGENPVNSAELTQINRNYLYKISATYTIRDAGVKFEILPWEYVEIDGDIEGVLIAVDSLAAMDWLRNVNSYVAPIRSFGADELMKVLLPVVTGTHEVQNDDAISDENITVYDYEFYEYAFDLSTATAANPVTFDLMNLDPANYVNPEGTMVSYISKLPWLESATMTFTSKYAGYIECKYKHAQVHHTNNALPIRFRSANVTKQFRSVYDNGYVPNEMLPEPTVDENGNILYEDWKKRAPLGIVFAKRGKALHPRDTEAVLYGNDGDYTGEHTLSADRIEEYCKSIGPTWYALSYEELLVAQKCVRELGASYRLQNVGDGITGSETKDEAWYWSSTKDEQTGYYWAVNMSHDAQEAEARLVDPNAQLFVRCVTDLK